MPSSVRVITASPSGRYGESISLAILFPAFAFLRYILNVAVYRTKERKTEFDQPDYPPDIDEEIISKSNTDSIDQGIEETLQQISHYMNPFFVEDYWGNTRSQRANFILFLLFLERADKIRLTQEEPFGNIQVIKLF